MIQRFFVSFVVCLLVLISQIALAADIDWDLVPRINSKAQLATYIENGRRNGQTEFHFTFPSVKINNQAELVKFVNDISYCTVISADTNGNWASHITEVGGYGTGRFIFKITKEYPGTRIANAYLSGDTSNLTMDEANLYNIAVEIVFEANKRSSEVEKARYIHDEICKRVKEWKSHTNEDAVGALVIGITNCQGFTDAFYMLGRMCGLNVGRIYGTYNKEPHVWNWITFRDGKSYCIDVTGGFNVKKLELLTFERMKNIYTCEWEIIPNLQ